MGAGLVHSRRVTEQAAAVHSSALTLCEFGIKFKVGKTFPKHPKIISIHTLIIQTPAFLIDIPHLQHSLQCNAPSSRNYWYSAGERWQWESICWIFTSQACLSAVETAGGEKLASHDLLAFPKLHLAVAGGKSVVKGSTWEPLTHTDSAFRASASSQTSAAPLSKEVHNCSACFFPYNSPEES